MIYDYWQATGQGWWWPWTLREASSFIFMTESWQHYSGERQRLMRGAGGLQCSVCTGYDSDRRWKNVAMCLTSSIPHGQAALLRSHAGGLSVVAAAERVLYAASEVSAILKEGKCWPLPPHSHTPVPSTTPTPASWITLYYSFIPPHPHPYCPTRHPLPCR